MHTYKVHPAADFPMMSGAELVELGEDIRKNGLKSRIVFWAAEPGAEVLLLDGRNRLAAMELVGISTENVQRTTLYGNQGADPVVNVISLNIHRRHLTGEQKRELVGKLLKAKPETSNNSIAKTVKVDDKTVAAVRREMESTSEIPKLEKTVGADGKARKPRAKKKRRDADDFKRDIAAKRAANTDKVLGEQATRSLFLMNCNTAAHVAEYDGPVDASILASCRRAAKAWTDLLANLEQAAAGVVPAVEPELPDIPPFLDRRLPAVDASAAVDAASEGEPSKTKH